MGERKMHIGSCWLSLGVPGVSCVPEDQSRAHTGLAGRAAPGGRGLQPRVADLPAYRLSPLRRNQAMRKKLILYFKRRNHARKQWVSTPPGRLVRQLDLSLESRLGGKAQASETRGAREQLRGGPGSGQARNPGRAERRALAGNLGSSAEDRRGFQAGERLAGRGRGRGGLGGACRGALGNELSPRSAAASQRPAVHPLPPAGGHVRGAARAVVEDGRSRCGSHRRFSKRSAAR